MENSELKNIVTKIKITGSQAFSSVAEHLLSYTEGPGFDPQPQGKWGEEELGKK